MIKLSAQEKMCLKEEVFRAIHYPLNHQKKTSLDISLFSESLRDKANSFITLLNNDELCGCMGSLKTDKPLIINLCQNAFSAAFADPRFPSMTTHHWPNVQVDIAILSELTLCSVRNEKHLLSILQPGRDGVVLEDIPLRATFLPAVWEKISQPQDFINMLKLKAGLPMNYWSDSTTWYRYETLSLGFHTRDFMNSSILYC